MKKNIFLRLGVYLTLGIASVLALTGCESDADTVKANIGTAADNFEVQRRIVFLNGITDRYMLVVEGLCSVDRSGDSKTLHVVCKTGPGRYVQHMLGLSDNVSFFVEQNLDSKVSAYHYRYIIKPQSILPDIDIKGSASELRDLIQ